MATIPQETVKKTITITAEQDKFLQMNQHINLSGVAQEGLEALMMTQGGVLPRDKFDTAKKTLGQRILAVLNTDTDKAFSVPEILRRLDMKVTVMNAIGAHAALLGLVALGRVESAYVAGEGYYGIKRKEKVGAKND